jgi:hypothetical protein
MNCVPHQFTPWWVCGDPHPWVNMGGDPVESWVLFFILKDMCHNIVRADMAR